MQSIFGLIRIVPSTKIDTVNNELYVKSDKTLHVTCPNWDYNNSIIYIEK